MLTNVSSFITADFIIGCSTARRIVRRASLALYALPVLLPVLPYRLGFPPYLNFDHSLLNGDGYRLGAVVGPQFAQDRGYMELRRAFADHQRFGDFAIGFALP